MDTLHSSSSSLCYFFLVEVGMVGDAGTNSFAGCMPRFLPVHSRSDLAGRCCRSEPRRAA